MNSKRSYLDAVNAGRQRRSYASLEQLNRSLDTLEQRIERNREEVAGRDAQRRAAQPYGQAAESPRMPARPRPSDYRSAYEQPYQSIARDFERVRKEEDGVAAFGKIAGELKGLREELRHQMAASLRGEFDTLRKDFQQSYASGGKAASKLGMDVERLSGAIQSLGDRTDDRSVNMLRLEIEQMKSALDTLAREETVRSVDRRWDAFDQRFDDFEHRISAGAGQRANSAELAALTDRIEQIGQAVGSLPESLSLRSLEEKVRTLAGALDHFIEQQGGHTTQTFGLIEERLDEISRAIVGATVAAQQQHMDPEPFERIEARISALAKQIEEVAEDRPGNEVMEHLAALSRRVDELAARSAMPDEAIERLAYQISVIADKVDHAPAMPNVGDIFSGIEQRFDVLSNLFERRQDDALEQGNMLFPRARAPPERRRRKVRPAPGERLARRQFDHEGDRRALLRARAEPRQRQARRRRRRGDPRPGNQARRHFQAARPVGEPVRRHRSGPRAQPGDAGRRALGASRQAGRAAAGVRRHLAAAHGNREVDRRQPRVRHGGRAQRCRERNSLARGQPAGNRRGLRACRRTQGAGDADAPLRRAQLQDLRGDPRHASQDRRPHGLAGERGRGA